MSLFLFFFYNKYIYAFTYFFTFSVRPFIQFNMHMFDIITIFKNIIESSQFFTWSICVTCFLLALKGLSIILLQLLFAWMCTHFDFFYNQTV